MSFPCLCSTCVSLTHTHSDLTHLKRSVVLVVLHDIHEVPSQGLQKIRRIHLGLDLELRAQPERQRHDFTANADYSNTHASFGRQIICGGTHTLVHFKHSTTRLRPHARWHHQIWHPARVRRTGHSLYIWESIRSLCGWITGKHVQFTFQSLF